MVSAPRNLWVLALMDSLFVVWDAPAVGVATSYRLAITRDLGNVETPPLFIEATVAPGIDMAPLIRHWGGRDDVEMSYALAVPSAAMTDLGVFVYAQDADGYSEAAWQPSSARDPAWFRPMDTAGRSGVAGVVNGGGSAVVAHADEKYSLRVHIPEALVTRALVRLQTLYPPYVPADAEGAMRVEVYRADDGRLVATSDEVLLGTARPDGWVALSFGTFGIQFASGDYDIAAAYGGTDALVLQGINGPQGEAFATVNNRVSDPYASSTDDPSGFGLETRWPDTPALFIEYVASWAVPTATPIEYARLPFPEAQRVLNSGVLEKPRLRATCSWHGTRIDPDRGSFCVVRSGSALAPLVGSVLRVTLNEGVRPRSVFVFCKAAMNLEFDDMTLSRRAFLGLTYLGRDQVTVTVEVASSGAAPPAAS